MLVFPDNHVMFLLKCSLRYVIPLKQISLHRNQIRKLSFEFPIYAAWKDKTMEVIDLTQTIHNKIQIYPGDPTPSINRFLTHEKD